MSGLTGAALSRPFYADHLHQTPRFFGILDGTRQHFQRQKI